MVYFVAIRKWLDKRFHYSERIRRARISVDNFDEAQETAVDTAIEMVSGFKSDDTKQDIKHTAKHTKWQSGLHPDALYKFSRRGSDYFIELKPVYEGEEDG